MAQWGVWRSAGDFLGEIFLSESPDLDAPVKASAKKATGFRRDFKPRKPLLS